MKPWFEPYAIVLTFGTGADDEYPLVAFDLALHGEAIENFKGARIADCNLIGVSSIVPPGVLLCQMRPDATPVEAQGLMVPTVYARVDTSGDEEITAAVGIGVPTNRAHAGIIFFEEGGPQNGYDRATTIGRLDGMIAKGMKFRGRDDWTVHHAVATSLATDGQAGLHRCAVAALCFVDEHMWDLFEPLVEPVSCQRP